MPPDGKSAISGKPLSSETHRDIVEASLQTVLGERPNNAPYLPPGEDTADKLPLSAGSHYVELIGAGTINMLAEAEVKDFAAVLQEKKEQGHAARVR